MDINRDDVKAGKVLPHLIENNVWVPPSLRINNSTLSEHCAREKLTEEEKTRLYPEYCTILSAPGKVLNEQRPDGTNPVTL